MGEFLNHKVRVTLKGAGMQGTSLQPDKDYFVYCHRRGSDETCMAFAVIADDQATAERYLGVGPAATPGLLENVANQYVIDKADLASRLNAAAGRPAGVAPVPVANNSPLRNCCTHNRNVTVHIVTNGPGPSPAVLLNKHITVTFRKENVNGTPLADPAFPPMASLDIRDVVEQDEKCTPHTLPANGVTQ